MSTAVETFNKIQDHAKEHSCNTTIDFVAELKAQGKELKNGAGMPQGDINTTYLDSFNRITSPYVKTEIFAGNQIAEGNTKGASHRVLDITGCTFYKLMQSNPLQSFVCESKNGFTLGHDEHAHIKFPPGVYFFTHQRAFGDDLKKSRD